MYIESYKYYNKIYKNSKGFHRGLGKGKILFTYVFLIFGFFLSPLLYIKGSWLYGKNKRKKNRVVEFIFGVTHLKISENIQLEGVDRFYFNLGKKGVNYFSDMRLLFIALVHGIEVYKLLIKAESDSIMKLNGVRLIKMVAIFKLANWHMKDYDVYVQYNDHIPYNVMLQKIAKKSGLKTVYIQHAPVSYKFPPLYHDFNALFSQDSFDKYQKTSNFNIDVDYEVFFDVRFQVERKTKLVNSNVVLVCFNKIDDIDKLEELVKRLIKENYQVIVRPHPEDERSFVFESGVVLSKEKTIWEDLERSSIVIVNESAVPLESIYFKKPTYKLSYLDYKFNDNYNFLKNGLITKDYNNIEDLLNDINKNYVPNDITKLNYFIGDVDDSISKLITLKEKIKAL